MQAHHSQIAYTKRIEAERRRLHETERRCERMRGSIADFRKLLGGDFLRREKDCAKSATELRLENQLQARRVWNRAVVADGFSFRRLDSSRRRYRHRGWPVV